MNDNLVAQARLRWVQRPFSDQPNPVRIISVLQQWWAQDLPTYMRDVAKGEWRDVPLEIE